jgi:outer membrane protein assembly factor BamB
VLLPRNVQPILAEGRMYVACGSNGVVALGEQTGTVLSRVKLGGVINCTLAYDQLTRTLFAGPSDGRRYELEPTNGSTLAA